MHPLKNKGLDTSSCLSNSQIKDEEESKLQSNMASQVKSILADKLSQDPSLNSLFQIDSSIADDDIVVSFLGTISMKPSKYRGASAILLQYQGTNILMDCAEGSYSQMMDHFGEGSKLDAAILGLRLIFITHLHGDHQLGIIKVLSERDKLVGGDKKEKIFAVVPYVMLPWLNEFRK